MKFDVVIIGGGLGGLTSAYILARSGMKVAVLEKNKTVGGCIQSFKRGGIAFDTGMHYIGGIESDGFLCKLWRYCGITDKISLRRLDDDAFDVFHIDGKSYPYASGYKMFTERLSELFPEERKNIANYAKGIADIADSSDIYKLRANPKLDISRSGVVSVNSYIDSITQNPTLRKVLAAPLPLYAGEKEITPLYLHALILDSYLSGAYRIIGGGETITTAFCTAIESCGGEIFTDTDVVELQCDSSLLRYAITASGERFEAKWFISDIHPAPLMEIITGSLIRKFYKKRISELRNSVSNFTLYLKFKEKSVAYLNKNDYFCFKDDVWGCEDYVGQDWPAGLLYMHEAVAKEEKFAKAAMVISYMKYDEVEQWGGTKSGHRGNDYEIFKRERSKIMMDKLCSCYPYLKSCIEEVWTSTPLTYRDYTNTFRGSGYGVVKDVNNLTGTIIPHRTKVPNLLLTGQNTNFHGLLGVSISAIATCSTIIGLDNIINKINKY